VSLFGQYVIVVTMLYLTILVVTNLYRLFTKLFIGSTCGPLSYPRISEHVWILDVLG
jgi:hypothetical protein